MSSIWSLIYETDSSGNPVFGDLGEFRDAVFAGADVKILYNPGGNSWWSRNCSSINVTRPGGTILIAATFMEAADTRFSGLGIDFVKDPFALVEHFVSSS
jgi:hypothetical protein